MPSLLPKLHPLATLFPFARVIGLLLLLSGVAVREIAAQPDITNIGGPYTTSEGRYIEVFLSARSGSEVTWQLQIPSRILTAEINPRFPSPATDGTAGYYRFGPMELRDSGVGVVIARNQTGSTTSLARYGFPLDVSVRPDRPEFGRETENLSVPAGAKATMLKRTYGALPMTLQWKKDGQNVPDATDETLTIEKTVGSDTGIYTLVATNKYGTTTSPASTLTVLLPASDVAITQQPPAALRVWVGQTATFQVAATGSGSLVYQWRRNGTPISGATAGTFFLPMVTVTDAGDYTVVVSNANGSLTSAAAVLTVLTPPEITRLPQSATVLLGAALSLQIEASGSAPLAYQWYRNDAPITGATGATFEIASARLADAGQYSVGITNEGGSVRSAVATVVVNLPGRLLNLSILTSLTASAPQFTLGAVLGGGGTEGAKPMLVRAVGPSLSAFGITNFLADPTLDVVAGSAKIAANNDWNGDAGVTTFSRDVGAFALGAGSKDAAVALAAMPSGASSIAVAGNGGGSGMVLAELYDASSNESLTGKTPRLLNCSVLKSIEGSLTAGFVIGGSSPVGVLIRAVGPTLSDFGVTGAVANPQLEVLDQAQRRVGQNEDWGGGAELAATFTKVGAFALPAASRDAAVSLTLQPGSYTVRISGGDQTVGTALLEIYEVR